MALRQLQVPEWLDNADDLIRRVLAEARNAGALDHRNIARLFTAGYKGFTIFLTSEFVEGQNIRDFVFNQKAGIPQIVALARQLCSALDYAQQKKIVHYALTPANLKVLPDGTLKILDFGLLRDKQLYSPTPAKRLESEHYLSPEQIRNKPVDAAANLFSAATILYELFTTRNPFAGKHLGEVDRNITDLDPTPACAAHSRVPEAISKVLMQALSKNPQARFQTAAELGAALEEAANPAPAKPLAAPAPVPAQPVSAAPATPSAPSTPVKSAPVISINSAKPVATAAPVQPPKPQPAAVPATIVMPAVSASPASKVPAKILAQWKLVGGAIAIIFVVSAMAISFNHRSKVSSRPEEAPQSATQQQQESPGANNSSAVPQTIEVHEVQPRAGKPRTAKSDSTPVPVAVTNGELAISSEPDGATIVVEGHAAQSWRTPQVLDSLSPGVYKVTLSKSGYSSETRSIEVLAGNRVSLDIRLTALKASLNVAGTPSGAKILIDGKDTGKTSPAEFSLDPAVHNVALHKDGYFDSATDVKLTAGQAASYAPTLKPAGRTDNIKIVGGGFKKIFGGGSSEGMSRLEIKTDPKGAQVIVNGTTLSKTTPLELQLEPGNYEIILQKDGYSSIHKSISTQANEKLKIDEQLAK
jgi:serine/threonine-protein kinase